MKRVIFIEKEFDLKTLHVEAGVRYWDGAKVNGENDTEDGMHIPCKSGDVWKPIIDLETGKILNWEKGKTADVHYKVCDAGSYYIKDAEGVTAMSIENDYVPSILCPKRDGYGDYIIMQIDENGFIQNWKVDFKDFDNE